MTDKRYKGTSFDKRRGKWKAQVRREGKTVHIGYFDTQIEAYEACTQATTQTQAVETAVAIKATSLTSYRKPLAKSRQQGTVAQSNVLIERPWSMNILEARCFVLLLQAMQTERTARELITIPVSDLIGNKRVGGRTYQLMHAALDRLSAMRIDLPTPNKKHDIHKAPLMGVLHLDSGQGTISGYFSPEAMPYLTNLLDSFTIGQVADLLSIKNPNSYKFYWIMMMWKFGSPHTVTVEELREITTGAETYPQYSDYRNRVLKPSLDELRQFNFDISYTENKAGRNVESLEFNIKYHKQKEQQLQPMQLKKQLQPMQTDKTEKTVQPMQPVHTENTMQQRVATRLQKLQLTEAQIRQVLRVLTADDEYKQLLKATHPLLVSVETRNPPIANVGASAMSLLKTTFPALYKDTLAR